MSLWRTPRVLTLWQFLRSAEPQRTFIARGGRAPEYLPQTAAARVSPGPEQTPRAYLYRSAVNLSLNVVRSRKNQRLSGDVELLEAPAPEPVAGGEDELQRSLVDVIAHLKPQAVEILILRYTHGYSDAQIARMLGKSRGTTAVTLYRTRSQLRKLLRAKRTEVKYEAR